MGKGTDPLKFHRALAAVVKLALTVHRKDHGYHQVWQTEFAILWITSNKLVPE